MTITVTGISISGGVFVLSETMIPSQTVYTTPGTYYWTCPAGVTLVSVVCVGGGGGGGNGRGGGGGGLGYKNNISVVPGLTYIVVVGAGGTSTSTDGTMGGDSYFIDPYIVKGGGGNPGVGGNGSATNVSNGTGGAGGNYVGDGGGNGGRGGGWVTQSSNNRRYGGGGGAGGYSGNGGNGGSGDASNGTISATAGTGGGGGGGNYVTGGISSIGGGGGGVGLLGQTTNGAAGTGGTGTASGGSGGSGGSSGTDGTSTGLSLSLNSVSGGNYGGGGGATYYNTSLGYGGDTVTAGGAVRIIWGTTGGVRKFPGPTYGTVDQSISTPVPSSDASLSNLVLSLGALTPAFSPSYFLPLPYQYICTALTSSYTLTATASNQYATIQISDFINPPVTITSGVATSSISLGGLNSNTARDIIVTAQDGSTRTYEVQVIQYAGSAVNTLSSLTLSSGTLSPTFNSSTTTYTVTVPSATGSINVTPTATDATSTIVVNGNGASASGSPVTVNLSYGSNTLNVYVTSQSGVTKTYTTTVTRQLSSIATLATLNVSGNSNGVAQTLTPSFASGTLTYSLPTQIWDYGGGQNSFAYRLTLTDSLSTVQFMDGAWNPTFATVPSDGSSFGGYLNAGTNTHRIKVTAQDGVTTNTYTFTIFKQAQGQEGFDWGAGAVQTWTVPAGVTSISVVSIGGGGAGGKVAALAYNKATGGGGGGLSYGNNIAVSQGQIITVYSGAGGAISASGGNGGAGGNSYFTINGAGQYVLGQGGGGGYLSASTVAQSGGTGGGSGGTGRSGGFAGGAGGTNGTSVSNSALLTAAWGSTGGGGAGGYTGAGGAGGAVTSSSGFAGNAGSGGGGGGGGGNNAPNKTYYNGSAAGGGVNLYGNTSAGTAGAGNSAGGYYQPFGGGGVGGGTNGGNGGSSYGFPAGSTLSGPVSPGYYGGGGAAGYYAGDGGYGAVRIVWPGAYRQYPSTNVSTDIY